MTTNRHLVGVWNPAYASDAMEATLQRLRAAVERFADGGDPDDLYVWWGKVRSQNRQQPLPHLAEILALDAEAAGRELHLYLTDYQSLYVAHVGEIIEDDPRADDAEHVPDYYSAQQLACDCWFKLWDIRRLVLDDTVAVVEELKRLRVPAYHDRPVSLYGGMRDLPLVVSRSDGARWFDLDVRNRLTDGKAWVEFDAERSGIAAMERELRDNVIGHDAWSRLDPAVRSFVASAEAVFRVHRGDPGFDFSGVLLDLAKAFEVQSNRVLREALSRAPRQEWWVNVDGRSVDAAGERLWTLGELHHILAGNQELNTALKRRLHEGEWYTASLPHILAELSTVRNPAAHTSRVSREEVTALRNRVLGIGVESSLVRLAAVRAL